MANRSGYMKQYRLNNKEKLNARERELYLKNREKVLERYRNYARKNRHIMNAIVRRRNQNPRCRVVKNLRGNISKLLKGKQKSQPFIKLLGCSVEDLWIYLDSRFKSGMTRDNYGTVWHVDHIIPCALFDLSRPEHQKRCFHFSNLQPMLAEDNWRKNKRLQWASQ